MQVLNEFKVFQNGHITKKLFHELPITFKIRIINFDLQKTD